MLHQSLRFRIAQQRCQDLEVPYDVQVVHRTSLEVAAVLQHLLIRLFDCDLGSGVKPATRVVSLEEPATPSQTDRIAQEMVRAQIPFDVPVKMFGLLPH